MDNAEPRLAGLQDRVEKLSAALEAASINLTLVSNSISQIEEASRSLQDAATKLAVADHGIEQVNAARIAAERVVEELRRARTMARKANWRLMAKYDAAFAVEFLDGLDPHILHSALMKLAPITQERLREWACNGGHEHEHESVLG
jgi:hypothetical protein